MKYIELKIQVAREHLEEAEAAMLEHGYNSMQIDDPLDALDIAEHRELYKYDYINEEISRKADEAARLLKGEDAGAAASGSAAPVIHSTAIIPKSMMSTVTAAIRVTLSPIPALL